MSEYQVLLGKISTTKELDMPSWQLLSQISNIHVLQSKLTVDVHWTLILSLEEALFIALFALSTLSRSAFSSASACIVIQCIVFRCFLFDIALDLFVLALGHVPACLALFYNQSLEWWQSPWYYNENFSLGADVPCAYCTSHHYGCIGCILSLQSQL